MINETNERNNINSEISSLKTKYLHNLTGVF